MLSDTQVSGGFGKFVLSSSHARWELCKGSFQTRIQRTVEDRKTTVEMAWPDEE